MCIVLVDRLQAIFAIPQVGESAIRTAAEPPPQLQRPPVLMETDEPRRLR